MGIFSGSNDCPAKPASAGVKGDPIAGSLTFQHLVSIISYVCVGVSVLLWLALVIPHLRRYKAPNEQRQIFRIVSTPVVFTIFAAISTHAYQAAEYLEPLSNCYEALALASLFLLYVHYVTPDATTRQSFFQNLEGRGRNGVVIQGGSLRWFWNTWRTVFIYVVVYTLLIIIQEITMATGVYCSTSNKVHHAHIWLQALQLIATIWAVVAVIRFQRRLKEYMQGNRAFLKLVMFKLFVLITTLQHFIFGIVSSHVTGGPKVTYDDITIGLPALLVCIEAVIFMVACHFIFNAREYRGSKESGPAYGFGRALLNAMNPTDLIQGIARAFGSIGRRNS